MKKLILALGLITFSFTAWTAAAEDFLSEPSPEREPAAVTNALSPKRTYPGGADEEDLRVQTALPEAALRTDARSIQREVYKALYNQELKDDRQDAVEE
ncbi:MAG: hypothetical protein HC883_06140 [Bdellovibrionaceae bacterium]|nr:hypothetical protein [Pseudobdellovibrionaceae bacterium]